MSQLRHENVFPYMYEHVLENGEIMFCVYGLGMVFCHMQEWQALVKLHCMQHAYAHTRQRIGASNPI